MGWKMKLIVGLGNPGKEYSETRHNIGYLFVEEIVSYYNQQFKLDKKLRSEIVRIKINDEDYIFLKPITFMNLSGEAVTLAMKYYNVDIDNLIIVHDDLDLPVGKIRIRPQGGSGGHNGIKSIIQHLKTQDFKRIRIGIDKGKYEVVDYVLGKFSKRDQDIIDEVIHIAPLMINYLATHNFDELMSEYNTDNHEE